MAKGTGLIGNFKGKVGNTVGYKLSASNNGQTQGIRVYQPIVKNPKTAAQAEQRAKLLAVNATYRALKMVIDRGNEGLPYGNKSRLAWLKGALKSTQMPWYVKGAVVGFPVGCAITKGSIPSLSYQPTDDGMEVNVPGLAGDTTINTIGALSTALLAGYPSLKDGDQITLVSIEIGVNGMNPKVQSFIIDATSAATSPSVEVTAGKMVFESFGATEPCAIIVSREGESGQHLRSSELLHLPTTFLTDAPYDATSKTAAIESYQSSAAANSDWAEESIQ